MSGINCNPRTAKMEMQKIKKFYRKEDGVIAYHGYQSFAPGEATPELAHEIGVKLARQLWGDRYQVLVATHLDRANHLHSHFVINTVSFVDGIKYHRTKQDYKEMQRVSDALCKEYGLSVIRNPKGRGKTYSEWAAEKEGKPTLRGVIRSDIDRAILASTTQQNFQEAMQTMGYTFKTRTSDGQPLKYPALKPPGAKGYLNKGLELLDTPGILWPKFWIVFTTMYAGKHPSRKLTEWRDSAIHLSPTPKPKAFTPCICATAMSCASSKSIRHP